GGAGAAFGTNLRRVHVRRRSPRLAPAFRLYGAGHPATCSRRPPVPFRGEAARGVPGSVAAGPGRPDLDQGGPDGGGGNEAPRERVAGPLRRTGRGCRPRTAPSTGDRDLPGGGLGGRGAVGRP